MSSRACSRRSEGLPRGLSWIKHSVLAWATGWPTSACRLTIRLTSRVLYQARIHPQHPVQDLDETQVADLHRYLREVPLKACEVNADSKQFPSNWLFKHRWGKGKKKRRKAAASTEGNTKAKPAAFLALVRCTLCQPQLTCSPTAVPRRSRSSPLAVARARSSPNSKRCRSRRSPQGSASEMCRTKVTPRPTSRPSSVVHDLRARGRLPGPGSRG